MQSDHDKFEEQAADGEAGPDAGPHAESDAVSVEDASEPDGDQPEVQPRAQPHHHPQPQRRLRRRFRKLKIASGVLAALLVLTIGGGVWWLNSSIHASYPQTTGTLRVPGLDAQVEVDRNAQGVPQVYAST